METIIKNVNKDTLKEALSKVGWSINGSESNEWIYNHLGERTSFWVRPDRIELRLSGPNGEFSVCYHYQGCTITILDNCVSLGTDSVFVQFYNIP